MSGCDFFYLFLIIQVSCFSGSKQERVTTKEPSKSGETLICDKQTLNSPFTHDPWKSGPRLTKKTCYVQNEIRLQIRIENVCVGEDPPYMIVMAMPKCECVDNSIFKFQPYKSDGKVEN